MSSQHSSQAASRQEQLRADLTAAMRRRDRTAVTVIRRLLAAFANNEAVAAPDGPYDPTVGLGHDVPRRVLGEAELTAIVQAEIDRHESGIAAAEDAGRTDRVDDLRAELDVLLRYR